MPPLDRMGLCEIQEEARKRSSVAQECAVSGAGDILRLARALEFAMVERDEALTEVRRRQKAAARVLEAWQTVRTEISPHRDREAMDRAVDALQKE